MDTPKEKGISTVDGFSGGCRDYQLTDDDCDGIIDEETDTHDVTLACAEGDCDDAKVMSIGGEEW